MRRAAPLLLALCLVGASGCAATKQETFRYDAPGNGLDLDSVLLLEGNAYDPAVFQLGDETWLAWLDYRPERGDSLWIGRRQDDAWVDRRILVEGNQGTRLARPTWTRTTGGDTTYAWLTWEQREDQTWDLAWAVFSESMRELRRATLETPGVNETDHAASAAGVGPVLIVARQDGPTGSRLALTALAYDPSRPDQTVDTGGVARAPRWETVSQNTARPWAPDIAGGPREALIVWDEFDGGAFQVRARALGSGRLGAVLSLTDSDRFEARAVVERTTEDDSFWVAWEEGERGWGTRYTGNDQAWNNSTDDRGSLHRLRRVRVARIGLDGDRLEIPPLDLPAYGQIADLGPRREGVREMGLYYERPELVVDGSGRPWVAYRHFAQAQLGRPETTHHHIENGWRVYARALEHDGWSPLYRLQHDQRDGRQRLALAPTSDGVVAVWTTGRTDRREDERPRGVALARLRRDVSATSAPKAAPKTTVRVSSAPKNAAKREEPPTARVGGRTWHLAYGDLHRHTDISLCFAFFDGSLDDAYRYARSVEQLDFLGITDHTRDIDQGDVQSLLWWRATKEVTRHHTPGVFHPFYSYERSQDDTDHNVISLRDDMLRNFPPPLPEFWAEIDDRNTITIPHTTHTVADEPFNGTVWDYQDDQRRPLAEVYQGFRDVSALRELQVPLAKGYHLGMIASSDHLSTGASYAAAWTEHLDRESVFDALRSRRTYGATDRIRLVFRAGDHWMGEVVRAEGPLDLQIEVEGTGPLEAVELWIDGAKRKSFTPETNASALRASAQLPPPAHYAFVRVVQRDGNRAWSSPIWRESTDR